MRRGDKHHKNDDILVTTMSTERCMLTHAFPPEPGPADVHHVRFTAASVLVPGPRLSAITAAPARSPSPGRAAGRSTSPAYR